MFDLLGHFYHAGDYARMGIIAGSTLASVPNDVVSMQFLGLAHVRTGNEWMGVALFHRAAGLMRERLASQKSGPSPFDPAGEHSAATRCLAEATQSAKSNPLMADAWQDIGLKWHELGYLEQAAAALRTALEAKPHLPEAEAALEAIAEEKAALP